MAQFRHFGRILHWGPIITYFIVFYVASITLYFIRMWWPPQDLGGVAHIAVFIVWVLLTVYNHMAAMVTGPGYSPICWKPDQKTDEEELFFCRLCTGYKPPRAHHCRQCQRCVLKMDHHCPWINTCAGHSNQLNFTLFTLFGPVGCLHATIVISYCIYLGVSRTYYIREHGVPPDHPVFMSVPVFIASVFAAGLAVGVVFAVGGLFISQLFSILRNRTQIEEFIVDNAKLRRSLFSLTDEENRNGSAQMSIKPFVFPYDLGKKRNFLQLLEISDVSDGFNWIVRDGCDRYSLTREQQEQRHGIEAQAVEVLIKQPYAAGACECWLVPLLDCCGPCEEGQRTAVNTGEKFLISKQTQNWLYGCRVMTKQEFDNKIPRARGWFPRACLEDSSPSDKKER